MSETLPFGRWMKQLRANLDLTQEALADAVGCAPQTIRTYESGRRRPSREIAERLADVLRVPPEQRANFIRVARTSVEPSALQGQKPEKLYDAQAEHAKTANAIPTPRSIPILTTKLYRPRLRTDLVSRPRLIAQLNAGLAGPLTIVAAPAGSGKTSLLVDWLSRQDSSTRVAWLALDATDSDPAQFLRYLIAAVQTIDRRIGVRLLSLLEAHHARLDGVFPLLVNELTLLPEPSILVLDDYHVIDSPAVHEMLQFLLDHLPPSLHLVIASRSDPPLTLARFRMRGQLTEVRAHDLRFTVEEAAAFLRDTMGLVLPTEQVAALETHTEGWIAGLQLAALSLRHRPGEQQAQFITTFTDSNRLVVDYLVDEVLAQLPPHLQTFLLQTSSLERLCGPLCDAVILGTESTHLTPSEGKQAYSQMLLEELERANLFIIPLDNIRCWYRYHHLFAQVLRARLTSGAREDALLLLNRRAVEWFEREGLIDDAVRHALRVSDLDRAIELIERYGMQLIDRREDVVVRRWIDQVPSTLLQTRSRLAILAGWIFAFMSRFEALDQLLQTMMHARNASALPMDIRGEVALLRALSARFQEQYPAALNFAHEALALLPPDQQARRARAIITAAVCLLHSGDMAGAEAAFHDAAMCAQSGGDPATALLASGWLATLYGRQGRLNDKLRTCSQIITSGEMVQDAPLPVLGAAWIRSGEVWYERNDLQQAEVAITEGLRLLSGAIEQLILAKGYVVRARIHQARGNPDAALAAIEEAEAWAARLQLDNWRFQGLLTACRVRLWLRQGNFDAAFKWADTVGLGNELHLNDVLHLTLIQVRLAQYRDQPDRSRLDQLVGMVARLSELVENLDWVHYRIELLLLQSMIVHVQGNLGAALNLLASALRLAAPEGYERIFLDEGAPLAALLTTALQRSEWGTAEHAHAHDVRRYSQHLLAAFEAEGITAARTPLALRTSDVDSLTERELEVLHLLTEGLSNQAIAEQLVVAVGTVKRHVNSILSKLAVQSRLQAVARARELNLV